MISKEDWIELPILAFEAIAILVGLNLLLIERNINRN